MRAAKASSDKSFGLVFAAACAVLAARAHRPGARAALLVLGAAFLAAAFLAPRALAPLNRAWGALGLALGRIVNPVVLAVLYYGVLAPAAFALRLAGRDELRLRPRGRETYWTEREPAVFDLAFFKRQF